MKMQCYMVIYGMNMDFDEVTSLMGTPPTRVRLARPQTEAMTQVGITYTDSWAYDLYATVAMMITESGSTVAKDGPYPDVMTLLSQLQQQFSGREAAIRDYCTAHSLEMKIQVVAQCEDDNLPFLSLTADFIEFMAALGAWLDYDLYTDMGWAKSGLIADKYLPLGSVVTLKDGEKKLMVYGRCQRDTAGDRVFDYVGVPYPEGNITAKATFLFNHEDIVSIHHLGFTDEEDWEWTDKLKTASLPPEAA